MSDSIVESISANHFPANLLPEHVVFALLHKSDDVLHKIKLHSQEENLAALISNEGRRASFVLGRQAAAITLKKLGIIGPVLKGDRQEPIWPIPVVGSISHSGGYALSIASISPDISGLGVDIELPSFKFSIKIAERICTPKEMSKLPVQCDLRFRKILKIFAAKEAFYKAVFPTIRRFLGFRDVELTWDEGDTRFYGTIIRSNFNQLGLVDGRVHDGHLMIALAILKRI